MDNEEVRKLFLLHLVDMSNNNRKVLKNVYFGVTNHDNGNDTVVKVWRRPPKAQETTAMWGIKPPVEKQDIKNVAEQAYAWLLLQQEDDNDGRYSGHGFGGYSL